MVVIVSDCAVGIMFKLLLCVVFCLKDDVVSCFVVAFVLGFEVGVKYILKVDVVFCWINGVVFSFILDAIYGLIVGVEFGLVDLVDITV